MYIICAPTSFSHESVFGECLKFLQVALLYKLDIIYSKSISNDVSVPSAEKITLVGMYQKSRYKDF